MQLPTTCKPAWDKRVSETERLHPLLMRHSLCPWLPDSRSMIGVTAAQLSMTCEAMREKCFSEMEFLR